MNTHSADGDCDNSADAVGCTNGVDGGCVIDRAARDDRARPRKGCSSNCSTVGRCKGSVARQAAMNDLASSEISLQHRVEFEREGNDTIPATGTNTIGFGFSGWKRAASTSVVAIGRGAGGLFMATAVKVFMGHNLFQLADEPISLTRNTG